MASWMGLWSLETIEGSALAEAIEDAAVAIPKDDASHCRRLEAAPKLVVAFGWLGVDRRETVNPNRHEMTKSMYRVILLFLFQTLNFPRFDWLSIKSEQMGFFEKTEDR